MEAGGNPADVMEGREQEDDVTNMNIELDGLGDEGMCGMGEGGLCGMAGVGGEGGKGGMGGGEEVKEAVSVAAAGVVRGAEGERDPPVKSRFRGVSHHRSVLSHLRAVLSHHRLSSCCRLVFRL
ncbi:unnamed protein product [Closterium sp. NIES-54]